MAFVCPACGATYATDETCEDRFNVSQVRESEVPAYYAVHHLSVPAYMLQHNAYSRVGWLMVRDLVVRFLAGARPEEIRRQERAALDSGTRTFSITRGPTLEGVEAVAWSRTIADVRLDTAAHYCADVRAWAASVISDSADLAARAGAAEG